jgi:hypothetical protein
MAWKGGYVSALTPALAALFLIGLSAALPAGVLYWLMEPTIVPNPGIAAYRPHSLVLVGNGATDDPEGDVILENIHSSVDEDIIVVKVDDPVLVNALQRRAGGPSVALRSLERSLGSHRSLPKSQRTNGLLVQVLTDPALRERLGSRAKETVRKRFLMSRLLEDWIDLLAIYEGRAPT